MRSREELDLKESLGAASRSASQYHEAPFGFSLAD